MNLQERFWRNVEITDGCWLWTASTLRSGYGQISDGPRSAARKFVAHRLSYEWHKGPIPDGYEVDHLCFVRRCVNPAHLEAVTGAENNRRAGARTTHCPQGHEYDLLNTYYRPGNGRRMCKRCYQEKNREWRRTHKRNRRDAA